LFTGIGGLDLGIKIAVPEARVICCVEADGYCQRLLFARMLDGSLDCCPIHGDVRTFDGRCWRGCVDLVCGGFPCQDISCAGRGAGIDGERSGLWAEMARIVGEVRPRYVFVENVAALVNRGMGRVLGDLSGLGYDAEWLTLSAADVGAPHLRQRVFILADAQCAERGPERLRGSDRGEGLDGERQSPARPRRGGAALAAAEGQRRERRPAELPVFPPGPGERDAWAAVVEDWPHLEPAVRRVAHGIPGRVDRLRGLGNAVVPLQAAVAFAVLLERLEER
jgi:DNA (cytosine-5)-methyltransferase 1